MTGKIWGLGVGPGDPDLITLKALTYLQKADVVAYPAPTEGESLTRSIISKHLSGSQIEYAIRTPMVTERFPAQDVYDVAAKEISNHAEAGRSVAVLCEGDPFVYGSFMFLFQRLVERWDVEVVPGVSSVTACAAVASSPLGARNDVLCVIPATLETAEIETRLRLCESAVIIKVGRHLGKVRDVLARNDLIEDAMYISHATMGQQEVSKLSDIVLETAPYFSVILVHHRGSAWCL